MPFKKLGTGKYEGPSGRKFNLAQVRLYYAHGGKFPGKMKDRAAVVSRGKRARIVPIHRAMA